MMSADKSEEDQMSDYDKTRMWLIVGGTVGAVVLILITVSVILIINFIKRRIALAKEVKQQARMQNAPRMPRRSSLSRNGNRNGLQSQSNVNDGESPPPADTAKWPGPPHPNVLLPRTFNDASSHVMPSVSVGIAMNRPVSRPLRPELQGDQVVDLPPESIPADYVDPLLWQTEDLDENNAAASQMNDDERRPPIKRRASFVSFVGEYKL
ncbi:hypothetical protein ECC02_006582 [Trypanosoma cruzi]|uniref:Uncharacterized protein n=1 Tax=Trypanosoma cruzi TaxID=5693 RepID=A0A7J6Y2P5_TRYCR|nr:hypothetical protein ECC02_006582 [Trypanosoma cruzi]